MPTATRTFRVFVSSTFEDLKAERDALQRDVFPKLRQLCEESGARFQAIDLRWGVRDEAALDQKTMEICLREIDRCQRTGVKPNFIVLLGDRYGWRPLPARIEAQEFERVRDRVTDALDQQLLGAWYQRENNVVPPEYSLKARSGEWTESESWQELEERLHRILREAAQAAELSAQAMVKYEASATHQEILKGLGATSEDRRHVFAFCRKVPDHDCDSDLLNLKHFLGDQLPEDNILPYDSGDLARLCQDVEQKLRAVIENEAASFESRSPLALEIEAHDSFARERALVFGRQQVLNSIREYISSDSDRPLVLRGASGSGKSAVMAQASEQALVALPSAVVIRRFIGASPESSSGLTLLRGFLEQIGAAYGATGELPADFNGMVRVYRERLALATAERPLVVFIDALDQLGEDDPAHSLTWLVGSLSPYCRVVLSTTDVAPALSKCRLLELEVLPPTDAAAALDHWLSTARQQLQPAQREKLLAAFNRCGLPLYLRLAFEEARGWASYLPLESCLLGDGVEGIIDTMLDRLSLGANHGLLLVSRSLGYLATSRYGLTEDEILDVLSADDEVWQDFEQRAHHTPSERRLPVIFWSRLYLDLEPYLTERIVPGGTVISFYHRQLAERATERFLADANGQARHKTLARYFAKQHLWFDSAQTQPNGRKAVELVHQQARGELVDDAAALLTGLPWIILKCQLGLVFDLQQDYRDILAVLPEAQEQFREERGRQAGLHRWTKEITHYARQWSERRDRLARGEAITELALPFPEPPGLCRMWTEEEIEAERRRVTEDPTRLDRMQAFASFVMQECYALIEFGMRPKFVEQHAFNYAPRGTVHDSAVRGLSTLGAPVLTRHWKSTDRYNPMPALLSRMEGHTDLVNSVSVTPDGACAVSASGDGTVRVWNLQTGACLRVLEVDNQLESATVTPDGRCAVTAASSFYSRQVVTWDLETGACLRESEKSRPADCVSVTPDRRRAVSVGHNDRDLRLWDLDTGHCLGVLQGHTDEVKSVCITPNFRRAVSGGWDKTLRVWELETGACLHILEGHSDMVLSVSITPDGRRAVSGSADHTLRVWDLESGACVRVLEGHSEDVRSVSLTPDGRRAVSGSDDRSVRVWDLEAGACLRRLEGHSERVWSVAVTADGRRAISAGGHDRTVRVWDLERGACLPVPEGHTTGIGIVSTIQGGWLALSVDWEGSMRVWDLRTGARGRLLPVRIMPLEFSVTSDGKRATEAEITGEVKVWDLETGACLRVLKAHPFGHTVATITPDGRHAVSAGKDYTVRVWDLKTGACLHELEGPEDTIWSVSLTQDCRRVVSGSSELRIWHLNTGACLRVREPHTGGIGTVSITSDGTRAVSESHWDTKLRVWDLETGVCLRVVDGDRPDAFSSVVLTPDNRFAVAAGRNDYAVRVWDLETGVCAAVLRLPASGTVALSRAFARVVVGTWAGEVLQFDPRGMTWAADTESKNHPDLAGGESVLATVAEERGAGDVQRWWRQTSDRIRYIKTRLSSLIRRSTT